MKINCIIQARMGSTRLPGKVEMDLGGYPMLKMVTERCQQAKNIDTVVLALHGKFHRLDWTEAGAPPLVKGLGMVFGPEEPAARFVKVLATYPCDGFVRVCADSPFIDASVVDAAAENIINGFPYSLVGRDNGNQAEGFDTQTFLRAESSMQGDEREHLGLCFKNATRLTVDTPGDLERARLIVSRMTKPHTEYTAAECLALLRE